MEGTVRNIEEQWHEIFRQMHLFQSEISKHSGKAVTALGGNLGKEAEFLSRCAATLLNLGYVIQHFFESMAMVDEGEGPSVRKNSRAAWQYSFSQMRLAEKVKVTPGAIQEASGTFAGNLENLERLFSKFDKTLHHIMGETKFPWFGIDGYWPEAGDKLRTVINEAKDRISELVKDAKRLAWEIKRVDRMLAYSMASQA